MRSKPCEVSNKTAEFPRLFVSLFPNGKHLQRIYEYWPLGTSRCCCRTLNERFWTPGVWVTRSCVCVLKLHTAYMYLVRNIVANLHKFASVALVESWEKPRYQSPERGKHCILWHARFEGQPENGNFQCYQKWLLF